LVTAEKWRLQTLSLVNIMNVIFLSSNASSVLIAVVQVLNLIGKYSPFLSL